MDHNHGDRYTIPGSEFFGEPVELINRTFGAAIWVFGGGRNTNPGSEFFAEPLKLIDRTFGAIERASLCAFRCCRTCKSEQAQQKHETEGNTY